MTHLHRQTRLPLVALATATLVLTACESPAETSGSRDDAGPTGSAGTPPAPATGPRTGRADQNPNRPYPDRSESSPMPETVTREDLERAAEQPLTPQ